MASDAEATDVSSFFERLSRHRDMSLFLPFILGFTGNISTREDYENSQNPEEETPRTNITSSERIILINPFTQGMVVIEGNSSLDSLLRNLATKDGQPPASKASVEAMPSIRVSETEKEGELGGECVVCLEEYEVGELVTEMPCKHKFHRNCIEKWLGLHGSCPICRYKMPVDDEEGGSKRDEQRREIWVSFSFNGARTIDGDSNQNESTSVSSDSSDLSNSSFPSSITYQEIEDQERF